MVSLLLKRYNQYLRMLPCHPTFRRGDRAWSAAWNARSRAVFVRFSFLLACLLVGGSWIAWPLFVLRGAWWSSGWRLGGEEPFLGRRLGLFARTVAGALRFRLRPREWRCLALADGKRGEDSARDYLSEGLVLALLAARNEASDVDILGDKKRFFEFFESRGLRSAPLWAFSGTGGLVEIRPFAEWKEDVFFKPQRGSRSLGVERWDWAEAGYVKAFSDGGVASTEALERRLRSLSKRQDYIAQPRLRNHPDLEDLSNGSVIVFRILTVSAEGRVEVLAPIAQLPYENEVDSVWRERVVAVSVEVDSGELRAILGERSVAGASDEHPVSGSPILGRKVPNWEEGMVLLRRAHALLPGVALVGWDLAFTPQGPCLIEGNSGPALLAHQLPPQLPLRKTALWDVLAREL